MMPTVDSRGFLFIFACAGFLTVGFFIATYWVEDGPRLRPQDIESEVDYSYLTARLENIDTYFASCPAPCVIEKYQHEQAYLVYPVRGVVTDWSVVHDFLFSLPTETTIIEINGNGQVGMLAAAMGMDAMLVIDVPLYWTIVTLSLNQQLGDKKFTIFGSDDLSVTDVRTVKTHITVVNMGEESDWVGDLTYTMKSDGVFTLI